MTQLDFFAHPLPTLLCAPPLAPTAPTMPQDDDAVCGLTRTLRGVWGWTCDVVPRDDKTQGQGRAWLLAGVMVAPYGEAQMLEAVMQRPPLVEGQRALAARLAAHVQDDGCVSWVLAMGALAMVRAPLMGRSGWGVVPLVSWMWGAQGRGQEDGRAALGVSPLVMPRADVEGAVLMGRRLAGQARALSLAWGG